MAKSRGPASATDLKADIAQRLRDDPDYRARHQRAEAERAERARRNAEAQRPVLHDLSSVGVNVDSVWNLYKVPDAAPKFVPVLIDHLRRDDCPDAVLTAVGTALDHKYSRPWWADIKDLYLTTDNPIVRDRLAATLSTCATKAHYQDLLAFIRRDDLGESRVYFLRTINRIGNRATPGGGRGIVASIADDPVFAKEAAAILARRGPND